MQRENTRRIIRVLIASNHDLFSHGLRSFLQKRLKVNIEFVGIVKNTAEAISALQLLTPDLIIVDYDDETLNRDEFLAQFVGGSGRSRVILLSLANPDQVMMVDRRELSLSQVERWFEGWQPSSETEEEQTTISVSSQQGYGLRRNRMKHLIIAGFLVILMTIALIFGASQVRLLPISASAQAVPIDNMFRLEFIVIAFLFSLIVVFMVYSVVVFRRRAGETGDGRHIEGNTKLEVTWTILPLITVLAFSVLGAQSLADTQRADPKALEVNVIGSQWVWRFEYPKWGIVSTELVMPVNKQAILYLSSIDVIHSFWVPEFRVKQDALPGGEEFVRELRVTPTLIGRYTVRCAELCGINHAYMESPVIVMSQADFDVWVAAQTGESADPVERGQKWATQYGCLSCHSIDGTTMVGPTWKGLYGSQVTFTDGTSTTADDAYLIQSIKNPGAVIVEGFTNLMPANIAADLTDEKLQDILAFIKSLK